jgi:probable F420-dependent oxidoreductase
LKIGAPFPLRQVGLEFGSVRAYIEGLDAIGCHHIRIGDHVLGVRPPDNWRGPYDYRDAFHEPFVMLGWMASFTQKLEFVTATLTLPQRQTALVAKQAAQLDQLLGGRMRLGVGVGWNPAEFEALGSNFGDRGRRLEEQIRVLRLLWTQDIVTFRGTWHTIVDAGINPPPIQRPIPIWIGGGPGSPTLSGERNPSQGDRVLRRIAVLADGWIPGPSFKLDQAGLDCIARLRDYVGEAGRPMDAVGIQGYISIRDFPSSDDWCAEAVKWKAIGASHLSVDTHNVGLTSLDAHLNAVRAFTEAVSPVIS